MLEISCRGSNIDSDDSDGYASSVYSVCSNCKHPTEKGEDLILCSSCHITRTAAYGAIRKIGNFTDLLGQEVGHCESLVLFHKNLYIVVNLETVTMLAILLIEAGIKPKQEVSL